MMGVHSSWIDERGMGMGVELEVVCMGVESGM